MPGEIHGLGAVPGWVIRDLVADVITTPGTAYRAVLYDPHTGELKALSSTHYVPYPALDHHVRHRDVTCRFPGCRRAARYCDNDHTHPHAKGGPTAACNLKCLCRSHHRLKQQPGWKIHQHDSTITWTSPTGHTYTTWPHDYRDPDHPIAPLEPTTPKTARNPGAPPEPCEPDPPPEDLEPPPPEDLEPPPQDVEPPPEELEAPPQDFEPLPLEFEPPPDDDGERAPAK
jgi:hypothetical protein